ncbi:hypothetical protein ncot_16565 [Nocardioides sp. JQ2195]|uniref:hypothetical protein n=1 Tax=Nocardioides sp. JQ2195 TaxID=2592334 RepID=UPI00143E26C3|nr:hypothetical protein [Nocardioides sp. JQ2195]QIX28022.1 hypothetical protein ncot_16565 [Nocardioides sp. JQ2195]
MRHRRIRLGTTAVAAVLIPILGLSACGSDDKDDSSNESSQTTDEGATADSDPSVAATVEEEALETEEPTEEPAEETAPTGAQPEWALPVTTPGKLLTTAEAGDISVEIYQVGTAKATDDGMFVDPDTNKPILKKGDELVIVNYVITNTGAPIDLGSSLVSISPRYDDWKWMQGMDGDTDDSLFEPQGVNPDELAPGGYNEAGVYTLGTDQSYSQGENFAYQKNSPITFDISVTPVDAKGDLLHDKGVDVEVKTTIE